MDRQNTIQNKVSLEGVGLHTGRKVKMEFLPAPSNSGVVFVRKDLFPEVTIKADLYAVLSPDKYPRRTSIGRENVFIHTIEHLMSAFHLLGIDNIYVHIWGEEVPGMDGSAKGFVEKLYEAKVVSQDAPRKYFVIREPLWVEENDSSIVVIPYDKTRISYTLKYDNAVINTGFLDIVLNGELSERIYEARTFCLEEEVDYLMKMGLGKGSNYENTLVVSKREIVKNELRFSDEFVKHKVLDLMGDLYLAGFIKAHIIAIRSGHNLNIKLLNKLKKYREKTLLGGVGSSENYFSKEGELSVEDIQRILPHRYPFLLIDRVVHMEKGKKAVGIKNVTINDYFFQGHFPAKAVMPGVLIIEAMAQVGGVLMLADEENKGKLAYFMAANNVKFRKPVVPGDQLVIEVTTGKIKKRTGTVLTKAFVDNRVVAEAELMFALVDS